MLPEYQIFERNEKYLIIFPTISFWFRTDLKGLIVLRNLRDGRIGKAEERLSKLIKEGSKKPGEKDYLLYLIEFEFSDYIEEKIDYFIEGVKDITGERCQIGCILDETDIKLEKMYSFLKRERLDYIELNCKNKAVSKEFCEMLAKSEIDTIHFYNLSLNKDTEAALNKLKIGNKEIIIHIDALEAKEVILEKIYYCSQRDYYIAFIWNVCIENYYETYKLIRKQCESLSWKIDYKKYCEVFNYDKIIKNRESRCCCGIGKDKIYIDKQGYIFSCQDCSTEKVLLLGSIEEAEFKEVWKSGRVTSFLRNISIDYIDGCNKCAVRYLCGGQCRMMSYKKNNKLNEKACFCEHEKRILMDLLWENITENEQSII